MLNSKMIGNKITEARKRINISQAQLAQRLFISSQAVGKWERGESMPDIIMLNRLAEILGVDLNYFSEGPDSSSNEIPAGEDQNNHSDESLSGKENMSVKTSEKPRWDLSRGNWVEADFSGLKNLNEKFSSSNMQCCKFIGSDLSGLLLKTNNVDSCDFSGSDISHSRIQYSNLLKNIFKDCLLKEAVFSGSNIEGCDFSGADISGTEFSRSLMYGCNFTGTDFTGVVIKSGGFTGVEKAADVKKNTIEDAVWNHTSFIDSQVADLVLTGTWVDCYFENCKFTRVMFRNATLVNTFFKNNKNLKRVQFKDCKANRMTYEFLKQGKADLTGISLLNSNGGDK
jgi:uncharacterized protein YjbI with pentapeptide repeats